MIDTSSFDNPALDRLRKDFPGHHIWRSRRWDGLLGEYVATLLDPKAGVDATVMRPDPVELRAELMREAVRAAGHCRNVR
ncbi:hypothetical protein E1293_45210 [Actinomadura darangshiensis]|uniref:Uncharacterized protein n=1 Tax=Actinomadura darangshiensis TaxID=705336 RepID=A0A4R4ZQ90_9ACTN|nr:hypothetical protein [Actinomadura darangshiensis]TDD61118.1 hypothetical protein E1293_45210 [Actinomadura darangshiensis]